MVEVKNLTKNFGELAAVNNISFTLETGEILGFLGRNGAGKTTTMKIITCYMPATSGNVLVDGMNIDSHSLEIRRKIGYLPETCPIYKGMGVNEYLNFIADVRDIPKDKRTSRINEVAEICGLTKVLQKDTANLSKGYQQRVGLAQAILHDPEILILDEPWTGLDPVQIIDIRNLIRELGKKKTVLFSSHILQEVEATCDRVLIIHNGNIVADGLTSEIKDKQVSDNTMFLEIANPPDTIIKDIQSIGNIKSVSHQDLGNKILKYKIEPENNAAITNALMKKVRNEKWDVIGLYKSKASLEDAFKELTKN